MDESFLQTVYRAGTAKPPVFEAINGDEVWLIKNPALYYPLDNQEARQRHSPKEAVNPTVCLWKAEIKCHPKSLVIKDHPKFKGVYVVKGKQQKVLKKFVRSLSWEKSSVPQCQGGMSMMDFNVIDQAVLYYMVDHPPTTPEDFNSHAELKAASHWYWPKDDEPKQPASGPHDDLRIKKVAAIALKSWKEELCQAQKQAVKRKQGSPVKAGRNDEKTDSSDDLDEYISDEWSVLNQPSTVRRPKKEVFEVEAILGERKRKRDREFLVKWRGWGSEWNSWEPERNFLSPSIIRDFEHPRLPPEEVAQFSEVLLNIFEAGLCQDLGSKFTIDFPIRAFNFFFRDKGQQHSRGTWALCKEEFSLCRFPRGWDRAWINARGTERELLFPVLLRPFLSRSTQLYHADGSKRARRWTQRLTISFCKHTV